MSVAHWNEGICPKRPALRDLRFQAGSVARKFARLLCVRNGHQVHAADLLSAVILLRPLPARAALDSRFTLPLWPRLKNHRELHRDCWRLQLPRRWSQDEQDKEQVCAGSPRTSGVDGFRPRAGSFLAMGSGDVDREEDRLTVPPARCSRARAVGNAAAACVGLARNAFST